MPLWRASAAASHPAVAPRQVIDRLAAERLVIHESQAQVVPTAQGIPWLGFVVYPNHRLLKRRKAVNFTRSLQLWLCDYRAGRISFAELDASVQGWINHVRYADTWGLREHIFASHPVKAAAARGCRRPGEVSPGTPSRGPESQRACRQG